MLSVGKRKYITGIDGLRSIAVVGVILYHLLPDNMPGGYLGVPLFFVISGFLMTDILLQQWHTRGKISLKSFYLKRIRRIYPSLITLFLIFGTVALILPRHFLTNYRAITLSSIFNVNNWWQIINGSSYFDRFSNQSAFTHLWSLSIEGQFYLVWPIVIALLMYKNSSHRKLWVTLSFGTILSAALMWFLYTPENINRIYYGTDTRLFSILVGGLLALVLRDCQEQIKKISKLTGMIAFLTSLIIVITSFMLINDNTALVYQGGMFLFSIACTVLLWSVIQFERINQTLTNPLFKWIGLRSYDIYLWQFPVMIVYEELLRLDGSHKWLHFVIQLLIILGLSELSYRVSVFMTSEFKWDFTNFRVALLSLKSKAVVASVSCLFLGFGMAFAVAPSGRADSSVALQKKLETNKRLIEEKKVTQKTSEKTTNSSLSKSNQTKDSTTTASTILTPKEVKKAETLKVSAVGDSVLLSAAPDFQATFKQSLIDAEIGRQLVDSEEVFKKLSQENKLGDVVVVSLGTNGSFSSKDIDVIMSYLKDRQVYFVNTMVERPWQKTVNDELIQTAKRYRNAHVIDWKSYSANHPEWFDVDNVHLVPEGAQAFSTLIAKEILESND